MKRIKHVCNGDGLSVVLKNCMKGFKPMLRIFRNMIMAAGICQILGCLVIVIDGVSEQSVTVEASDAVSMMKVLLVTFLVWGTAMEMMRCFLEACKKEGIF